MIERETGYNTHEDPRPGECYCHLLRGAVLCQVCQDLLIAAHPDELLGSGCYCEEDKLCSAHAKRITPAEAFRLGYNLTRERKSA